jgi:putative DNA primase/helicase
MRKMRRDAIEQEALKMMEENDFSEQAETKSPPHSPFSVTDDGVFYIRDGADPIRLAARVDVIAETRDDQGENWGRLLRWKDGEGRMHQWAMPLDALACDSGAVRAKLLNGGLPFVTTNARYRERFAEYLQTSPVNQRVRCVPRIGWHEDTFVLPDEAIGPEDAEEILYQPSNESSHHWRTQGSAMEWREHVGRRCSGNSRLIIAASCGFAGPLLSRVGAESGGVHFTGGTSTGKTTALVVGGSVCGGGGQLGFVQTWRTTINGLEAIAEAHNDGTLFLDELSQVDPMTAAETAYLLGNGQGKARMTRGIGARKRLRWNLLFVSAGEMTLAEHASSAGKRTRGGADVRLLNIDADAGQGLGMFENLHGAHSPDAFARDLKEHALSNYGSPLRIFVERLTRNAKEAVQFVKSTREEFIRQCVPARGVGELRRAADRFALIAAAGELATQWGLTGWRTGEAVEAAQRCFEEWMNARGTAGPSDLEAAIRQVRAFLESNGGGRFQALSAMPADAGAERISNRAGFKRLDGDGETEYLILKEIFSNEVCRGYSSSAVLKELDRRGFLVRDHPNMTIKPRLPELGSVRVYCIRAAILDGHE